jgi:predicted dehydrogenase
VVAAPNDVHLDLASRALDAGLPVVVDKPLAPTAAEARSLVEQAEGLGVLITAFMNRRWDSDQLTLRRLLDEGALGEVLRYESRLERWRPALSADGPWREVSAPEAGGGVLLDLGSHLVDQAIALFGPVGRIYAELESRRGGVADDDVFLALEHRSGTRSHLWASLVAAAPGPRLRVLGDRAGYIVTEVDGQEDALRAGAMPSDDGDWGVEPPQRWGRLIIEENSEAVASERGDWPRFYIELERALREGSPPPVDPSDAVTGLEVLDAARRSAATAAVVAL